MSDLTPAKRRKLEQRIREMGDDDAVIDPVPGETAAILMAQDAWHATDTLEKFDTACPPVVYSIAREAYRMGRRASPESEPNENL